MEVPTPTPYQQPIGPAHSFMERVIGAAKLERPTFDEVRRDPSSMGQAAIVVAVTGFLSGIGSFFGNWNQSVTIDNRTYTAGGSVLSGIAAGVANVILALIVWVVISLIYRFVAIRMLGSSQAEIQWQEVARPIGFASAPGLLAVFSPIPLLGPLVSFVGSIWTFAAQIVALSETFHVTKWRAFAIVVVSAIAIIAVLTLIGCICVLALVAVTR